MTELFQVNDQVAKCVNATIKNVKPVFIQKRLFLLSNSMHDFR